MTKNYKNRSHKKLKRFALNAACAFTFICLNNDVTASKNKNNLNDKENKASIKETIKETIKNNKNYKNQEIDLDTTINLTQQELDLIEHNPDILYVYIDPETVNIFKNNIFTEHIYNSNNSDNCKYKADLDVFINYIDNNKIVSHSDILNAINIALKYCSNANNKDSENLPENLIVKLTELKENLGSVEFLEK